MPISSRHVGVAAEAFAAGQFARLGFDVSVQYGANQPEYDLVVVRGDDILKVSVKGSQDGEWGLTQTYLPKRTPNGEDRTDYHNAIEKFCDKHSAKTIFCLVQFKDVPEGSLPRFYLATPNEIGHRLRETAKGRGDTILYEKKVWTAKAHASGTTDAIPDSWKFTRERIEKLLSV